jgi:hypothetical protein
MLRYSGHAKNGLFFEESVIFFIFAEVMSDFGGPDLAQGKTS